MEGVLTVQTLMGLSAVKELNDTLKATVETQRALADKVSPYLSSVFFCVSRSHVEVITSQLSYSLFLSGGGDEGGWWVF